MSLAIFDLDNTLLRGDSDHGWGEFLVERGIVAGDTFKQANDQFYEDYVNGTLDIEAYVAFALSPVIDMSPAERDALHKEFMAEKIEPMILSKAEALIAEHKQNDDTLIIITATNSFITAPIATRLGIEHLLATDPEMIDGQFSGKIDGTPCFQGGKVTRLNEWLKGRQENVEDAYFYSDSANDIPLLSEVSKPVAVDPDDKLRAHADTQGWPIISLR